MIFHIKEFEKKMIDNDLNRKMLAKKIGMSPSTLSAKLEKEDSSFRIPEAIAIGNTLSLRLDEFMLIFFDKNLSSNEIISA